MDYQINFQNTGNDTASYIIIRDTISSYLDISSIIDGPSSHPHTFNVYGQGIAEWVFDPIALPDSNVDEAGSHGFVKYKIKQNEGNLYGTVIENSAAIYFDYNTPVITNVTVNTVCELPTSSFTNVTSGDSVYFINQSTNSTKYFWMFGDGQSDTSQNPVHWYPGGGQFNVCLFALNDCEMSLVCNPLSIIVNVEDKDSYDNFLVFPNPSSGIIYLENMNPTRGPTNLFSIYDVYGRKVLSDVCRNEKRQAFDLTNLPTGIYLMERKTIYKTERIKIVIK